MKGWWTGLRLVQVALCGLLIAASPMPQDGGDEDAAVLRSYYSGNGFLNRGLYDLAASEYRSFLDEHDDHDKADVARYGLGVSLFRLERFEEAAEELARLRGRPFDFAAEAEITLGQCQLALQDYQTAAATFGGIVTAHPDHDLVDDAAALQAESLYYADDHAAVAAPCMLLVERAPDSPFRERAELFWGLAEMARDRYEPAVERFEGMQERFPGGKHADQVGLLLAQSLHQLGTTDRAAQQYQQVIDDADEAYVPEAMYGLALLQHQVGDAGAAGETLDVMLERFPSHDLDEAARFLRGRAHFDVESYDDARAVFGPIAREGETLRVDASYWMAKCDLRMGRPDEAATRLADTLGEVPESPLAAEMTYDLAVALLRDERDDEAIRVLDVFLTAYPDHALAVDGLYLSAVTLHQQGAYEESSARCRAFEQQHPDADQLAAIRFLDGENAYLDGDYARASVAHQRFLELHADDAQADKSRFRTGMSYYHLGSLDEAQPWLESVVAGDETEPSFRPALLALGDCHFQSGRWPEAETQLDAYLGFGTDQVSADDAMLKLALSIHRQERLEEALQAYDRLLDEHEESPHRLQATFERGQVLVALENPDAAETSFVAVLDEGPDSRFAVHALNHLGAIEMARGNYDEAAGHFGALVERDPEADMQAEAMYQRGQALIAAEQYDEAVRTLQSLQENHDGHRRIPQGAALLGIATARSGDHEPALTRIEEAETAYGAQLEPSLLAALLYEKAWSQRELDRSDDANATYRALLDVPGDHRLQLHARLELAELEYDADRVEQSAQELEALRRLLESRDDGPAGLIEQATYRLGVCRHDLGEDEEATALFETFIEAAPDDERVASARLLCGESLARLGHHDRATQHLQHLVDDHPDDESYGPGLLLLGESHAALQRWPESEEAFAAYLADLPDSKLWYQAQFGIGWSHENRTNFDEAIDAYRKVIDGHRGPTAARAQFQVGECLFAQERFEEAVRELLKVDILYAYPEWSAAAIYEAGRCFEELSNPVDARKQFEQVVNEHGPTQWAQLAAQRLEELSQVELPGHRGDGADASRESME